LLCFLEETNVSTKRRNVRAILSLGGIIRDVTPWFSWTHQTLKNHRKHFSLCIRGSYVNCNYISLFNCENSFLLMFMFSYESLYITPWFFLRPIKLWKIIGIFFYINIFIKFHISQKYFLFWCSLSLHLEKVLKT
jgi:hypothetical protein